MKGRDITKQLNTHGDKVVPQILCALGDELTQVQRDIGNLVTTVNGIVEAQQLLTQLLSVQDQQLNKIIQESDRD